MGGSQISHFLPMDCAVLRILPCFGTRHWHFPLFTTTGSCNPAVHPGCLNSLFDNVLCDSGVPGGVKEHANNHHPGTCGKHLALHQVFLLKVDPGRRGGWGRVVRMRERHSGKMFTMLLVRAAMCLAAVSTAGGQSSSLPQGNAINRSGSRDTSQQVWLGTCEATDSTIPKIIVIGFVGGFAKRDDAKHPEVQFAAQLRVRYSSRSMPKCFQITKAKSSPSGLVPTRHRS